MTISRQTTRYKGACIVVFNGVTFFSQDPVKVSTAYETFDISTSAYGVVDKRLKQLVTKVSFTPAGELEGTSPSSVLETLFPHINPVLGSSAMPSASLDLVVWPMNGKEKITYSNAYVSKMPSLTLSAQKTLFGSVEFSSFGKDNDAWTSAAHLYTLADAAFTSTALGVSAIKTVPYTASWGALSAPWAAIQTIDGWEVSFETALDAEEEDGAGVYDYTYGVGQGVTATCKPIGLTVADIHAVMALQGTGVDRGTSILAKKNDLTITGGSTNVIAVLKNMTIMEAPHTYDRGLGAHRIDSLTFKHQRNYTSGAMDVLATLGVVA